MIHFRFVFRRKRCGRYETVLHRLLVFGNGAAWLAWMSWCFVRFYPAAWLHRWHGLRFEEREALMLVSRGAGDTFPFRFNCPREVILCEAT